VLVVVAEYMNQEGECAISQDTIAARLGMTRQTVNRHLAILDDMGILYSVKKKEGVLKRYILATGGLEEKRFGEALVEQRREAKRAAKRRKFNRDAATPKSKQAPPEETAPHDVREPEPPREAEAPATAHVNPDDAWMIGAEARHEKFGSGIIEGIDGGKVLVRFSSGTKKIVRDFLTIYAGPARATP
jgi:DNA-binding transcriptional ArsR family regulator